MNDQENIQTESPEETLEEILSQTEEIREKVRRITLLALKGKPFSLKAVGDVVDDIMKRTIMELEDAPADSFKIKVESVYRGVNDACIASVNAACDTIKSAGGKGLEMTEEELQNLKNYVQGVESRLSDALTSIVGHSNAVITDPLEQVIRDLQQEKSRLEPHLQTLFALLKEKPIKTATLTTGAFLKGVSGVLQAAGDALGDIKPTEHEVDSPPPREGEE